MKVTIDREECIDCGVCYIDCPEVFEEDDADNTSRIIEAYWVGADQCSQGHRARGRARGNDQRDARAVSRTASMV